MGWLELIPLLKRLLPLLSRVAPMLETFAAARAGTRTDDTALERLSEDLRHQLAETAGTQTGLAELVKAQGAQITAVADSLSRQRATEERTAARLLEIESAAAALARSLRVLSILVIVCIALGIAVLAVLLSHFYA